MEHHTPPEVPHALQAYSTPVESTKSNDSSPSSLPTRLMGSHLDRPPRTSKEDLKGRAVLGTQAGVEFRSLVEPLGMERGRRRAEKMLLDCREHRFRPARVDAGTTRKVPHRVREVRRPCSSSGTIAILAGSSPRIWSRNAMDERVRPP